MRINESHQNFINQSNITHDHISNSYRKLSNGKKINRASDGPAQLIAINRLSASIETSTEEIRNEYDLMSLNTVADASLSTVNQNLQQIRELAVQAQNSTYGDAQKEAIQGQIDDLIHKTQSTIDNSLFSRKQLLEAGNNLSDVLNGITYNDIDKIDNAIEEVSSQRADLGSKVQESQSFINSKLIELEEQNESISVIRDMDMALGIMELTKEEVKNHTNIMSIKEIMSFNKTRITELLS